MALQGSLLPGAAVAVDDPLLDAIAGVDALAVARAYFAELGHDVDAMLARSDLHPRPGKDQHAFQIRIVRGSDVRALCNLAPTVRWLETTLHELGHAAYDAASTSAAVAAARARAHFTTEAMAMLHGRRARDRVFLERSPGSTRPSPGTMRTARPRGATGSCSPPGCR